MQTAKAITELPDTPANHAMRVLWATMVEVTRATG